MISTIRARRAALIFASLAANFTAAFGGPQANADERPNFIVLLADDLGYGDLSLTGNAYAQTPHIDRFARTSLRFSQGYAPAPQCSPTRASILSGQYPGRVRVTTWIPQPGNEDKAFRDRYRNMALPTPRDALPLQTTTLAEVLRDAGYATLNLGKWHIGDEGRAAVDQGFDRQPGWRPWSFPKSWFAPFGLETLRDYPKGTYLTDALTDEAIAFMKQNRERPFFMMFQYYSVHAPLKGRPDDVEAMRRKGAGTGRDSGYPNARYEAMKVGLDRNVGRLLDALERLDLEEDTVVVFTSDNGGVTRHARNAPYRAGKKAFYEGGIHVPFFIRWPDRTEPGTRTDAPVSAMDLYPTFVEAAGAEPPEDQPMDGVSLLPLIRDPDANLNREALFWHFPHLSYTHTDTIAPQGVVRRGDFKLIHRYHPDASPELYDLAKDPGETRNLAAEQPGRVGAMTRLLRDHLRATDAQMPEPNNLF